MGRSATPPLKGFFSSATTSAAATTTTTPTVKNAVRINFVFDSILVYKQHAR